MSAILRNETQAPFYMPNKPVVGHRRRAAVNRPSVVYVQGDAGGLAVG